MPAKPAARARKAWHSRRLAAALVLAAVLTLLVGYLSARQLASRPDAVLRQALVHSLQARSADVSLSLAIDSKGQPQGRWQLQGLLAQQGIFDLTGTYHKAGRSLGIDLRSTDGKDVYLKLSHVADLQAVLGDQAADYGLTAGNPIRPLEAKWLIVPADLKQTILRNEPSSAAAQRLDDADRQRMASLYGQYPFLEITETVRPSPQDPAGTSHYKLTIKVDELQHYLQAAKTQVPKLQLTDKQIGSLTAFARTTTVHDIWISKADKRITRFDFRLNDNGSRWYARLDARDYDRDAQVRTPDGAVPLFEALSSLSSDAAAR